jgi:hypothetical protein
LLIALQFHHGGGRSPRAPEATFEQGAAPVVEEACLTPFACRDAIVVWVWAVAARSGKKIDRAIKALAAP